MSLLFADDRCIPGGGISLQEGCASTRPARRPRVQQGSDGRSPTSETRRDGVRHLKIIGLCLAAVFAIAAVTASTASAKKPEWGKCVAQAGGKYLDGNCQTKGKGGRFEWKKGATLPERSVHRPQRRQRWRSEHRRWTLRRRKRQRHRVPDGKVRRRRRRSSKPEKAHSSQSNAKTRPTPAKPTARTRSPTST